MQFKFMMNIDLFGSIILPITLVQLLVIWPPKQSQDIWLKEVKIILIWTKRQPAT